MVSLPEFWHSVHAAVYPRVIVLFQIEEPIITVQFGCYTRMYDIIHSDVLSRHFEDINAHSCNCSDWAIHVQAFKRTLPHNVVLNNLMTDLCI